MDFKDFQFWMPISSLLEISITVLLKRLVSAPNVSGSRLGGLGRTRDRDRMSQRLRAGMASGAAKEARSWKRSPTWMVDLYGKLVGKDTVFFHGSYDTIQLIYNMSQQSKNTPRPVPVENNGNLGRCFPSGWWFFMCSMNAACGATSLIRNKHIMIIYGVLTYCLDLLGTLNIRIKYDKFYSIRCWQALTLTFHRIFTDSSFYFIQTFHEVLSWRFGVQGPPET